MSRGRIFLGTLGLPPRIRATWGARVKILPQAAWNAADAREGGVFYTIEPIITWGRFARVTVAASERLARRADEPLQEYASGATYYLMNLDGEWVIVAESAWVT